MTLEEFIAETIHRGGEIRVLSTQDEESLRLNRRQVLVVWKWPGMPAWEQTHMNFSPSIEKQHIKQGIDMLMLDLLRWFERFEPPIKKLIDALARNPWRHV